MAEEGVSSRVEWKEEGNEVKDREKIEYREVTRNAQKVIREKRDIETTKVRGALHTSEYIGVGLRGGNQ